jgi:hypothetical protein
MTILTANESVEKALRQANGPVEVRDEAGNLLGFYAPIPPEQAAHYRGAFPLNGSAEDGADPLADLRGEFDMAAVEREMALNEKGSTLAEVYEHLLTITPEPGWRAYLQEKIARLKERDRCATP